MVDVYFGQTRRHWASFYYLGIGWSVVSSWAIAQNKTALLKQDGFYSLLSVYVGTSEIFRRSLSLCCNESTCSW